MVPAFVYSLLYVTLSQFAFTAGEGAFGPLFEQYHQLQTSLAADDLAGAKSSVNAMQVAAAKIDDKRMRRSLRKTWKEQRDLLNTALTMSQAAADMEGLRDHFRQISLVLVHLFKASQPTGFFQFHCPMAFEYQGAGWLQKGDQARNPYLGKRNLTCGERVHLAQKTKKSASRGGHEHAHE